MADNNIKFYKEKIKLEEENKDRAIKDLSLADEVLNNFEKMLLER